MGDHSDPTRWSDARSDAPAELRTLLARAERDLPDDRQLASLAARLGPALSPPGGAAPAPTNGAASLVGARLAGLLAIGAVAGGLALFWAGRDEPTSAPPEPSALQQIAPPPAPPQATPAPEPTPAPEHEAPPEPSAAEAPTADAAPPKRAPRAAAQGEGEAELLERARRALAQDPKRALALTRQHQARFPKGLLTQEREVIAIEALRRLGREQDAKQRAGTFEKNYPDSAHRRAVEAGRE